MIELTIPQLDEESKNVKDLVFSILTREPLLSIIELTNRIKKNYNVSITYQAVRKAIDKLNEQGVLVKEVKKYKISKKWILNLKTFFDKLLTKYDSGKEIHKFTTDLAKENYAVYTLNTLFELDNFWGDLIEYWSDHIKQDEKKIALCYGHYAWWMLINIGQETKLYQQLVNKKISIHFLLWKKLPLNQWAANVYRSIGVKAKVINNKKIEENIAVNIWGNTVMQVHYPKEIVRKIKKFFEKYSTTQNMSMKELTELVHTTTNIKLIIFQNPTIAQNLLKTYLKYF